jgi:hypothetical protein
VVHKYNLTFPQKRKNSSQLACAEELISFKEDIFLFGEGVFSLEYFIF